MAEFDTRIQQKSDTQVNFETNNPVLLQNELVIVKMTDGSIKFKIGDGVSSFNSLQYTDKYLTDDIDNIYTELDSIPDVSNLVSAVDVQGIEATIPPTFDGHTIQDFVLKSNVVDNLTSSSTNVPLSANQGRILNQSIQSNQTSVQNLSTELEQTNTTVSNLSSSTNSSISSLSSNITALSSTVDGKLNLSGGTMVGTLVAQSNSNYTTGQVRNIYLSTSEPTTSDGQNGDIWLVYEV